MSNVGESRETLSIGEVVADVEISEKLGAGGGGHCWAGAREDGSRAVVFALDGALGEAERDRFLAAAADATAQTPADGIVPVLSVDPIAGAYVGGVDAAGTLADLPVLNWDRKRRVELFRRLCEIVGNLHEQGIVHGWLRPENILLDGEFSPMVANAHTLDIGELCRTDAGMVWLHRVYVPPEVRHGATADYYADTFALGRIFHFALAGVEPDEKDERLPRLDSLVKDNPNSLIRIIRKCTTSNPNDRYHSAAQIVEELDRAQRHVPVGMPHPEIDGKEESSMVDDERMRSRPPPKKAPKSTGVAIEIKDTSPGAYRYWSVGMAVGLGFLGLLMLAIPMLVTRLLGGESFALEVVMWASALPIGFATPGFTKSRTLTRLLVSVIVAAALVFSAPLDWIRAQRTAGLDSPKVEERVAALKKLKAYGSEQPDSRRCEPEKCEPHQREVQEELDG
jgi:hypothetical protein